MRRTVVSICLVALVIPLHALALSPAIPDAGVVVYARRNLETVGNELNAAAAQAGWTCERPAPANPLAQNDLFLQCKSPTGRGHIIADDFVDPLDRASVQGYSDAPNLEEMLRVLREFVRRVSAIRDARILFQNVLEQP